VPQEPKGNQNFGNSNTKTARKTTMSGSTTGAWTAAFKETCEIVGEKKLELDLAAAVVSQLLSGSISSEKINAVLVEQDLDKSGTCNLAEFIYVMRTLSQ